MHDSPRVLYLFNNDEVFLAISVLYIAKFNTAFNVISYQICFHTFKMLIRD